MSRKAELMSGASPQSLRELILGVGRPAPHPVPGLRLGGQQVFICGLTGTERDALESASSALSEEARKLGWRGRFVAAVLCAETGERLFSQDDAPALNALDSEFLDAVIVAAGAINRFGAAGVAEAEKNSEPDPSASSTSASPSALAEP